MRIKGAKVIGHIWTQPAKPKLFTFCWLIPVSGYCVIRGVQIADTLLESGGTRQGNGLGEDVYPSRIRRPMWTDKGERSLYAEHCARTFMVGSSEHGGTECTQPLSWR